MCRLWLCWCVHSHVIWENEFSYKITKSTSCDVCLAFVTPFRPHTASTGRPGSEWPFARRDGAAKKVSNQHCFPLNRGVLSNISSEEIFFCCRRCSKVAPTPYAVVFLLHTRPLSPPGNNEALQWQDNTHTNMRTHRPVLIKASCWFGSE